MAFFLFYLLLVTVVKALNSPLEQYLGSKSPYPTPLRLGPQLYNLIQHQTPSCSLIQVHYIGRHGTRYPSLKDFNAIEKVLLKVASLNVSSEQEWMKHWRNPYPKELCGQLVAKGEDELFRIGQRTRERYAQIFDTTSYNPVHFKFQSSSVPRAGQSASAFAQGFFQGNGHLGDCKSSSVFVDVIPQDLFLNIDDGCPQWKADFKEYRSHEKQQYEMRILPNILKRLNTYFQSPDYLTSEDIFGLFTLCQYDVAHEKSQIGSWCKILMEEELLQMEYLKDLSAYWKEGYGRELNEGMACLLMDDILKEIDLLLQGESSVKGNFKFGHASTIKFFLAFLGLYKDEFPLTSDLTLDKISARRYSLGKMSPFASNFIIEVFGCQEGAVIRFRHNEVPVIVPGCQGEEFCPLKKFKEYHQKKLEGCSLSNYCWRK